MDLLGVESSEVEDTLVLEVRLEPEVPVEVVHEELCARANANEYTGTAWGFLFLLLILVLLCVYFLFVKYFEADVVKKNAAQDDRKQMSATLSDRLKDVEATIAIIEREISYDNDESLDFDADEDCSHDHGYSAGPPKDFHFVEARLKTATTGLSSLLKTLNEEGALMLYHELESVEDTLSRIQALMPVFGALVVSDSNRDSFPGAKIDDYLRGANLLDSISTRITDKIRKGQQKVQTMLKSAESRLRFCVERVEDIFREGCDRADVDVLLTHTSMLRVFQERERFPAKLITRYGERSAHQLEELIKKALVYVLKCMTEKEEQKVARAGEGFLPTMASFREPYVNDGRILVKADHGCADHRDTIGLSGSSGESASAATASSPSERRMKIKVESALAESGSHCETTEGTQSGFCLSENHMPASKALDLRGSSKDVVMSVSNKSNDMDVLVERMQHSNIISLGALRLGRLDLIEQQMAASKSKAETQFDMDEKTLKDARMQQHAAWLTSAWDKTENDVAVGDAAGKLKKRKTDAFYLHLQQRMQQDMIWLTAVVTVSILLYCIALYGCQGVGSLLLRISAQVDSVCLYLAESPLGEKTEATSSAASPGVFQSIASRASAILSSTSSFLKDTSGLGAAFKWVMTSKLVCMGRILFVMMVPILIAKILRFMGFTKIANWGLICTAYWSFRDAIHSAFWFLEPLWTMIAVQCVLASACYWDPWLYWYLTPRIDAALKWAMAKPMLLGRLLFKMHLPVLVAELLRACGFAARFSNGGFWLTAVYVSFTNSTDSAYVFLSSYWSLLLTVHLSFVRPIHFSFLSFVYLLSREYFAPMSTGDAPATAATQKTQQHKSKPTNVRIAVLYFIYPLLCWTFSLVLGTRGAVETYSRGVQIGVSRGYVELMSITCGTIKRCISK